MGLLREALQHSAEDGFSVAIAVLIDAHGFSKKTSGRVLATGCSPKPASILPRSIAVHGSKGMHPIAAFTEEIRCS